MAEDRTDEDLLRSFVDGDESSFTELMRRHEDRIFALAFRMTGDRGDALDATQETFLTAFRQAPQFRFDSAFGTWLYRVGINASHDLLRKRRRWTLRSEDDEEQEPDRAGAAVDESVVLRLDLTRALAELPSEYREAVVMHDIGGVPYEEIAHITEARIGTVKSRISRGRRRLAELLEHPTPRGGSKEQI